MRRGNRVINGSPSASSHAILGRLCGFSRFPSNDEPIRNIVSLERRSRRLKVAKQARRAGTRKRHGLVIDDVPKCPLDDRPTAPVVARHGRGKNGERAFSDIQGYARVTSTLTWPRLSPSSPSLTDESPAMTPPLSLFAWSMTAPALMSSGFGSSSSKTHTGVPSGQCW